MLVDMKFQGIVIGISLTKNQITDRNINIFLAVSSSASIAAWAVWSKIPLLWSSIIALSQIITAVKPLFFYNRLIRELHIRKSRIEQQNIETERLWSKIETGSLTFIEIEQFYYDYKIIYEEILHLPEDVIFKPSAKTIKEAEAHTTLHLKVYYSTIPKKPEQKP